MGSDIFFSCLKMHHFKGSLQSECLAPQNKIKIYLTFILINILVRILKHTTEPLIEKEKQC